MTDWKCPRCDEWFEYEDHDTQHLKERAVAALKRIADAIGGTTQPDVDPGPIPGEAEYPSRFGQQVGAEGGLPADLQERADEIR